LEFLQRPNAKTLVSGTRDRESLHLKLKHSFAAAFPGELEDLEKKKQEKHGRASKTFWESVTDDQGKGFTFGF
jgi:hypothetical protein